MKIITQTLRACIGASALLLSVSAVQAADPAPVKAPNFSQLDTNRDGYIDAKEANASLEVSGWLTTADKDKDGRLSASEFAAAQAAIGIEQK